MKFCCAERWLAFGWLSMLWGCLLLTQSTTAATTADTGRVFVINAPLKDLAGFRKLVRQLEVLKPYGKIQVNVSTLADKSFHEIPEKGSAWHEYASANPTPFKFFPDARLAPFIPAEFVKKNRQLLLEKAKILREAGMEASFLGYEPNFMPAAFFEAYPEFLGARVDHPRRSTQMEFAPCVHQKDTRELLAGMMTEMLRQAPEITSFSFKTNDAGAGICWSDWLYTGANGPAQCKHMSTGERVRQLLEAYQEGAARAGRKLSIYLDESNSNFSEAERASIEAELPPGCYFKSNNRRALVNVGGTLGSLYPVTGILNPVAFLDQLQSLPRNENKTIFISLRAAYDRGVERADMSEMIINLVARRFRDTASWQGADGEMTELKKLCREWGGPQSAETLTNACVALQEAFTYKSTTFPAVHSLYWGVTVRLMTRPLVVAPQLLAPAEEAYFLPYVFNISTEEARMDYTDIHGGRFTVPPNVVANYVLRIQRAATLFDQLDTQAPQRDFFSRMATSLRVHAGIIRSCGNFAAAQAIRDRNAEALAGPARLPDKASSWTGHPDFITFNNIMRDELDNTNAMIRLLENGGAQQVIVADKPLYEDRFLLGPDLAAQLKQKRKIMMRHWQDIEKYLASPLK
ncbi:hypothetical protein WJU16_19005 [Chitinophaga pollutisoli]|uniref:Glycosyl hydrolase family 115 n=1 Tax=Chitinophaga pollutisoli TaxID=3133966 RepID=A0ABZ2YK01_9BACT